MDAFAGSIGVSDSDGKSTPVYSVCTAKQNLNNQYYAYALREMARAGHIQSLYRGIRERSSDFRFEVFAAQFLPLPPREEQDQIVRYLDWKVSQVNRLVNAKKKQIGFLQEQKREAINAAVTKGLNPDVPMKDCGIEMLGLVPKEWNVILNHRLFRETTRPYVGDGKTVLSLSQKDGLLPYVDMKERSLHTASYDNWKVVKERDIVLNRFKAHLGVFFSAQLEGIVTFHYGVFEPKNKGIVNSKYYEYLYHHPVYKAIYAGESNGMTVGLQNLSNQNFYGVYTLLPPKDEQDKLVEFCLSVEKRANTIVASIEQQITRLHEYRTRLISDVVTGKLDVRVVTVPEFEAVEEAAAEDETQDEDETTDTEAE